MEIQCSNNEIPCSAHVPQLGSCALRFLVQHMVCRTLNFSVKKFHSARCMPATLQFKDFTPLSKTACPSTLVGIQGSSWPMISTSLLILPHNSRDFQASMTSSKQSWMPKKGRSQDCHRAEKAISFLSRAHWQRSFGAPPLDSGGLEQGGLAT